MQFSTLSRVLLSASLLSFPIHAAQMTQKQIELSVNNHIAWMQNDGSIVAMAECSGKSEAAIVAGFRSFMPHCLRGDPDQYELCYANEFRSLLGLTDLQIEACAGSEEADEEDRFFELKDKEEELLAELEELQSNGDNSDANFDKVEALQQQLQDLYREMEPLEQAQADRNARLWDVTTNEVRKINETLAPLETHDEHNMPLDLDEPWRGMSPSFDHLPYEQQTAKEVQWMVCANMTSDVTFAAETIGAVKHQPEAYGITDAQNQQALREQYHATYGTFLDDIDNKIVEISLSDWQFAHTEKGMHDIAKKAWEWCQGQPLEKFAELDTTRTYLPD